MELRLWEFILSILSMDSFFPMVFKNVILSKESTVELLFWYTSLRIRYLQEKKPVTLTLPTPTPFDFHTAFSSLLHKDRLRLQQWRGLLFSCNKLSLKKLTYDLSPFAIIFKSPWDVFSTNDHKTYHVSHLILLWWKRFYKSQITALIYVNRRRRLNR